MYLYRRTLVEFISGRLDTYTDLDYALVENLLGAYFNVYIEVVDEDTLDIQWLNISLNPALIPDHGIMIRDITLQNDRPDLLTGIDPTILNPLVHLQEIAYIDAWTSGYDLQLYGEDWVGGSSLQPTVARDPLYQKVNTNSHLFINRALNSSSRLYGNTLIRRSERLVKRTLVSIDGLFHRSAIMGDKFYAYQGKDIISYFGRPSPCVSLFCFPSGNQLTYVDLGTTIVRESILQYTIQLSAPIPDGGLPLFIFAGHLLYEGKGFTRVDASTIVLDLSVIPYSNWMDSYGTFFSEHYDPDNPATELDEAVIRDILAHSNTFMVMVDNASYLRFNSTNLPLTTQSGRYTLCDKPTRPLISNQTGDFICYRRRLTKKTGTWQLAIKDKRQVYATTHTPDIYTFSRPAFGIGRFLSMSIAHPF